MNDVQIFSNPEFGQVRTVDIGGEPWFVGKDVASALGYEDTVNAMKKHIDSEDKIMGCQNATPSITDSMGRIQYPTWINESGLYALIFGSRIPSAKKFKHWVTSEVLPALRKAGTYSIPPKEAKQRELTKDDYIRAASIIAGCRNERMPYVMNFLERAGFEVPKIEEIQEKAEAKYEGAEEETFEEYLEELKVAAWERRGRIMVTCGQFNDFCSQRGISARKFRQWLYRNGCIMASSSQGKLNYAVNVWLDGKVERCVVFRAGRACIPTTHGCANTLTC